MTDLAEIKSLLAKAEAIGVKYSGIAEREQYGLNVFSILRNDDEEVGLHSAFLAAILNPDSGHGQGKWFLNNLLTQAGLERIPEGSETQVFREYTRLRNETNGSERDSIDIFIKAGRRAIVIENKIYAEDQKKQIERYVRFACDEDFHEDNVDVIYLTLDGHPPTPDSLGNYEGKVTTMSYEEDVIPWLKKCIEHMVKYPTTRETLVLYQRIVQGLTGQAMNEEENMEIADLLMETPQSFETTSKIVAAFDEAKAKTQLQFWEGLQSELTSLGLKKSAIMDESEKGQKYTIDKIRAFYTKKRNRPWYGIKVLLGTMKQHPELQICFYMEVDGNIYYGFIVQKIDGKRIRDTKINGEIKEVFKKNYKSTDWWPAWRHPQDENGRFDLEINFKIFEGKSLELIDERHRKSYLAKLAQEVKEAIQEGVDILKRNGLLTYEEVWDNSAL